MKEIFGERLTDNSGLPDEDFRAAMRDLVPAAEAVAEAQPDESPLARMERVRAKLDAEKESIKALVEFVADGENLHIVRDGMVARTITPYAKPAKKASKAGRAMLAAATLDVSAQVAPPVEPVAPFAPAPTAAAAPPKMATAAATMAAPNP